MKSTWKLIVLVLILALLGVGLWLIQEKDQEKIIEQAKLEETVREAKKAVKQTNSSIDDPDTLEVETPENSISDTSYWKTYRNEDFGFEVKIPRNWIFSDAEYTKEEVRNDPDKAVQFGFGTPISKSGGFLTGVNIQSLKKDSTKQEIDRKKEEYAKTGHQLMVREVFINGQSMKLICPTTGCDADESFLGKSYIFDHDGLFWTILFGTDSKHDKEEKAIFEAFSSSFLLIP